MTCASQVGRRLLFSIIRSPSLSHQTLPLRNAAQTRLISTSQSQSQSQLNTGFSITFGPKIDNLLETHGKTGSSKSASKTRGKKKTSRTSVKQNTAESSSQQDSTSNGSNRVKAAGGFKEGTAQEAGGETTNNTGDVPSRSATIDDSLTIELSEDAYDEISRPQSKKPTVEIRSTKQDGRNHVKVHTNTGGRVSATRGVGVSSASTIMPRRKSEPWQIQKDALKRKFGEDGWNPRKKLSPDALEGIRSLHDQDPARYSTEMLSQQFKVSPEAIRRILKSKWRPSAEKMEDRRERWARRHDRIWDQKAALGLRPPRTRDKDPEGPEAFEEEVRAKQMLGKM